MFSQDKPETMIMTAAIDIRKEILEYVKYTHRLLIDDPTVDSMNSVISTFSEEAEQEIDVRGRNLVSGLYENIKIRPIEVGKALQASN